MFVAALVLLAGEFQMAATDQQSGPVKAGLCDLVDRPTEYAGKMVAVDGWVVRNKSRLMLSTYSEGNCVSNVSLVLSDGVRPRPDFETQRDEQFRTFQTAVRQRTHIEGTFEGRFDCLEACKALDEKRSSHKSRRPMRLIVFRVLALHITNT